MAILGKNVSMRGAAALLLWIALPVPPAHAADTPTYVGAEACVQCHAKVSAQWAESHHSKMLQPATPEGVQGDFSRGRVTLHGSSFVLQKQGGGYYITETYLSGKPWRHRVLYTLGNRRIQHYLTRLPDGRIVLLPPSWDVVRKQWFHNLDIDDPEEVPGVQVQLWNKSCYSCHVSQEKKNFDLRTVRYQTSWLNFGVNCERCHGPGSEHVADYAVVAPLPPDPEVVDIVNPARLDPVRSSMVCAQCHSFRDVWVDGFSGGANYYDYFLPVLDYGLPDAQDPAYWADGRTRRFSNDAFGLWQSECFLKGRATCVTCHSTPHNTNVDQALELRADNNALCLRCHSQIAKDVPAHTHHAAASPGSSCVECHMPRTVLSIKAQIRDHSMSIPAPENTIHHGIPNACNGCHQNRDAGWALAQMDRWYGGQSRQKLIRRADAFSAARKNNPDAIASLVAILTEPAEGPLPRANAAGYLGRFMKDLRASDAVSRALHDPEPLVRAVAASALTRRADRQTIIAELVPLLGDRVNTVRAAAAIGLVWLGVRGLPGDDGRRFESAKQIYRARMELNGDDAEQQVAAGRFFFLSGDFSRAAAAFREGLKIDPSFPAQYYLAMAYAAQGDADAARAVLEKIPRNHPQYQQAQQSLRAMGSKGASPKRQSGLVIGGAVSKPGPEKPNQ